MPWIVDVALVRQWSVVPSSGTVSFSVHVAAGDEVNNLKLLLRSRDLFLQIGKLDFTFLKDSFLRTTSLRDEVRARTDRRAHLSFFLSYQGVQVLGSVLSGAFHSVGLLCQHVPLVGCEIDLRLLLVDLGVPWLKLLLLRLNLGVEDVRLACVLLKQDDNLVSEVQLEKNEGNHPSSYR